MRTRHIISIFQGFVAPLCLILALAGIAGATEPVKAGDKVRVGFTCRLQNGEVAATTEKTITEDESVRKARVFQARKSEDPLVITAGPDEEVYGKPGQRGFEGEIVAEAARAVIGMKAGETRTLEVKRDRSRGRGNEPMVIEMARIRSRAKETRMTPEEYKGRTNSDPKVGQAYTTDPAFPGKVSSVSETEVLIRFEAEPGKTVKTPLGDGVVRETERAYELVIDAKEGTLVRSANLVGRIVRVDERMVTIDYSHPFGFETLKCEVKVESVEEAESTSVKAEGK